MTSPVSVEIGRDLNRRVWAAGVPKRADARLRRFARTEGEAVLCRLCDGQQVILSNRLRGSLEPKKCPRCGGEGLEPGARE